MPPGRERRSRSRESVGRYHDAPAPGATNSSPTSMHEPRAVFAAGPGDKRFLHLNVRPPAFRSARRASRPRGPLSGGRVPDAAFGVEGGRRNGGAVVQFDDHVRRAREDHLRAHHHRLPLHVGEHVGAAGDLEHVVEKPVAAACVHVSQRPAVASDHEQRLGTRQPSYPCPDGGQPLLDLLCRRLGGLLQPNPRAERSHGLGDVGQVPMHVWVDRNAGTLDLPLQLDLCVVHDDEIRPERQKPLDVRIDEAADAGNLLDVRWKVIVVADAHHAVAGADLEEHFGGGRHQRDDAPRTVAGRRGGACSDLDRGGTAGVRACFKPGLKACATCESARQREACPSLHPRRKSSHRKNGPPMMAVTIPTGSSTGASAVRAMRSQPIRKAAPNNADAGSTSR